MSVWPLRVLSTAPVAASRRVIVLSSPASGQHAAVGRIGQRQGHRIGDAFRRLQTPLDDPSIGDVGTHLPAWLRRHVPEPDGPIEARGGEAVAVRGERHVDDAASSARAGGRSPGPRPGPRAGWRPRPGRSRASGHPARTRHPAGGTSMESTPSGHPWPDPRGRRSGRRNPRRGSGHRAAKAMRQPAARGPSRVACTFNVPVSVSVISACPVPLTIAASVLPSGANAKLSIRGRCSSGCAPLAFPSRYPRA